MHLRTLLTFLALAFVAPLFGADKSAVIAALTKLDDERLAATQAADKARLNAVFSDELRYAHSSGKIDTKASYIEALVTKATVYSKFEYKERSFSVVAPGVAMMTGRALFHVVSGGKDNDLDVNYLAVFREEKGQWKFLAYQSCKNPPPAAPAAK